MDRSPFVLAVRSGISFPAATGLGSMARQGVATIVSERIRIVYSNMCDVEPDGRTIGEVVMRGNNAMLAATTADPRTQQHSPSPEVGFTPRGISES